MCTRRKNKKQIKYGKNSKEIANQYLKLTTPQTSPRQLIDFKADDQK